MREKIPNLLSRHHKGPKPLFYPLRFSNSNLFYPKSFFIQVNVNLNLSKLLNLDKGSAGTGFVICHRDWDSTEISLVCGAEFKLENIQSFVCSGPKFGTGLRPKHLQSCCRDQDQKMFFISPMCHVFS